MRIKKHVKTHMEHEAGKRVGPLIRQTILGGQDGIVNTLGLLLGIAAATNDSKIVIIAGLAAAMAESISMAAVAYTSSKAEKEYYLKELEREKWEVKNIPEMEREEIKIIYYKKGFRGRQLKDIVKKITSNKELWLETMMNEELRLAESKSKKPVTEGAVVGVSSAAGSLIPLLPFFVMPTGEAVVSGLIASMAVLFAAGAIKSKFTAVNWLKSGAELAIIGTAAAMLGYLIGALLGAGL